MALVLAPAKKYLPKNERTPLNRIHPTGLIGHFTVVFSATRPLNGSEGGGDLVLIQTSLLLFCKSGCSDANGLHLREKSRKVSTNARSPPASLPFKGLVTEQTTVKWPINLLLLYFYSFILARRHTDTTKRYKTFLHGCKTYFFKNKNFMYYKNISNISLIYDSALKRSSTISFASN